jgi:inner membrane protein
MLAGFLAAAFPDIDFALRLIDTLTYLNWHQGATHSLVLLPLWGCLVAWLLARLMPSYSWRAFYGVAVLGIAIHIIEDVITAYGVQLLTPLSGWRYAVPLSFVIDPYFTAILIIGLTATLLLAEQRLAAILSLISLGVYISMQAVLRTQAVQFGLTYAQAQRLEGAISLALPQPWSPFHWKVIVRHGDNYHEALIDLLGQAGKLSSHTPDGLIGKLKARYEPLAIAHWCYHTRFGDDQSHSRLVRSTWEDAALAEFRRFAQLPVFDHLEQREEGLCIWFADLRFTLPGVTSSFRYGACQSNNDGHWRLERLRGSFFID